MAQPDSAKRPWAATRRGLVSTARLHRGGVLPGSLRRHRMRCGKPGCACKADPPALHDTLHPVDPDRRWKTVTRFLSQDQLNRYQPWFDNARRVKELVAKLEVVSVQALESEVRRAATTSDAARHRSPAVPGYSAAGGANPGSPGAATTRRRSTDGRAKHLLRARLHPGALGPFKGAAPNCYGRV